jgi:hypothetical protein
LPKLSALAAQYLSTRSVGMNLARPFKAGKSVTEQLRRVATHEKGHEFSRRYATSTKNNRYPGVEAPG